MNKFKENNLKILLLKESINLPYQNQDKLINKNKHNYSNLKFSKM